MPVPGDVVDATPLEEGRAVLERVEERTFALERRTAGGRTKIMAANVDTIVIVASFARPAFWPAMLDQLLCFAELHALRALVVLTKPDLADDGERESLPALYGAIGYHVMVVNPKAGDNVDDLRAALAERHSLLVGQSGVGKSSLFRALGGTAVIGATSKGGRGKQTTTAARLLRFARGFLIDSPGVGEFALGAISAGEVTEGFIDLRPFAGTCRFNDCTHRSEPGCGVRGAVEAGLVAAVRYESYRRILLDAGTAV